MNRNIFMVLPAMVWLGACVNGVEPPEPTALVRIDAGVFEFGIEEPCFNADEADSHATCGNPFLLPKVYPSVKINLPAFAIEEHEVTNGQYWYCYEMGECDLPEYVNAGQTQQNYFGNQGYNDYPVVNVSQAMAEQYCKFVGRELPNELQWERAASGAGGAARVVPVRDGVDLETCVTDHYEININFCTGKLDTTKVKSMLDDVVTEGAGQIYDMAGNVSEWIKGVFKDEPTCAGLFEDCQDCWACGKDEQCQQDCYTKCVECSESDLCYKMCPEYQGLGLPICLRYDEMDSLSMTNEQILEEFVDLGDMGQRMTRGGNYKDDKGGTCRTWATDRLRTQYSAGYVLPTIGFRCVSNSVE